MSAKPRVSAIITTYNRVDYLVEAIESVLGQTYQDFELIVADDGSVDDTQARMATYAGRIRHLLLPHSGRLEDTRNAALLVAEGELIAFLEDDDMWRDDKLAQQVAVFDNDASMGMTYSDVQIILTDGTLSPAVLSAEQKQSADVFTHLLEGCFINPSTVMVRKALFDEIGLFDQRFSSQADYYFWLRAAHAAPVYCLPEPLTLVRRDGASHSGSHALQNHICAVDVLDDVRTTVLLKGKQRLIIRRTLARWHTHVGLALRAKEPHQASNHFCWSLRLNPFQRRAWLALLGRS
jgi:glycosyltransferase involved in cell wall biosynthesis